MLQQKSQLCVVAHISGFSYSGCGDQKDHGLKPVQAQT
jgi:hypothetical protein